MILQLFLFFWVISALFIVREKKPVRIIIYLAIFSLLTSACFLLVGAPDVAMAEAVISAFSTVIFIVSFQKYYSLVDSSTESKEKTSFAGHIFSLGFVVFLFVLFLYFLPAGSAEPFLKDKYITMFSRDIGGENAVTAIYLGYRVYDTLFEALMLLVSSVAVIHLSMYQGDVVLSGRRRDINRSDIADMTIRILCPALLLFAVYLIMNGHISPGGGFQGGVVFASVFMCRYMVHAIYDIRINPVVLFEKFIFTAIVLLASFFIFLAGYSYLPIPQALYLIILNLFIGLKVACGFLIIFYRFVAYEWR